MPAAACMSRPQEMAALLPGLLVLFGFFFVVGESDVAGEGSLSRSSFPPGFIFGTASSAYQYEGAATEGGRGPSIWDTFVAQYPERIKGRGNASVAVDSYHRYKEDVKIMKEMGVDAYRFSISWTRILPNGSLRGGVNKEGIAYYNHLIDELVSHDVQPFVTLFHWDSPQGLEDLYGGFLSPRIISDFVDYAEVCFREFGDRVKHWITFNEPWSFCVVGYARGEFPPGRCSPWEVGRCRAGDSATEPYTAGHHQLLAHAAAVKLYRQKYQGVQKGAIGITLVSNWFVPFRKSKSDEDAAQRGLDFMLGWFMDPLTQGDYPFSMRALVGDRLPRFTVEEAEMVKGSFDFIGLNYYTAFFAMALPFSNEVNASYSRDVFSVLSGSLNGTSIGPKAASEWLYVYPAGIREVLLYTSEKYNNPVIYITESGVDEKNNEALTLEGALRDDFRISFYERHLLQVRRAIRKGADVRGFFAWSLLDNFEWTDGYTVRFGLHYVDYRNGLKRHPKSSAAWFRRLLRPSRR